MYQENIIILEEDVIREMEPSIPNLSQDLIQAQMILKQCSNGSGDCLLVKFSPYKNNFLIFFLIPLDTITWQKSFKEYFVTVLKTSWIILRSIVANSGETNSIMKIYPQGFLISHTVFKMLVKSFETFRSFSNKNLL